jgi:hypothetical protein
MVPRGGGDGRVRADVVLSEVSVGPGEPAYVEVEVTNVSEVIRSYRIDVLGLDARWSHSDGVDLELFPGERRSTTLSIDLPPDFPAGRRRIAIEVTEPDVPDGSGVVIDVDLLVEPREELSFAVEPASMTVGAEGTFVVTPVNSGNTTLDVHLVAADPERKLDVTFDPAVPSLLPGERGVVRATVRGPRPWFGMPLVRVLEFRATAGTAQATTAAAFIQTPRFSRRIVSMAGLVVVATLFAFVIFLSFGSVADLAAANEALLKQSLGEDQPVGLRVEPASVAGRATALTGGGIDGVTVELYGASNPLVPFKSTVTDTSGSYRFAALPKGTYFVRFQVAGFGEAWFRRGTSIADATPLEIVAGQDLVDVDVALSGQPGTVIGRVVGSDVDGALVVAQIPAESIEDSEITPVAARLAEVVVDATGAFILEGLPTPAGYEIVVSKPGFSVQRRSLTLLAGEVRRDFEVLLRAGGGLIGGTVVDLSGDPVPGATIVVSDGQTEVSTRSLSEADVLGSFEVRDLTTPSTYALTVSAPGFFPATQNIVLGLDQQITERRVALTPSAGSISGRVTSSAGDPLGGVEVTVVGPGLRRTTQSVSTPLDWAGSEPPASAGTWRIDGLPVPGAYTVTFGAEGQLTQAVSVELVAGVASVRTGVNAVLDPSAGRIQGRVREAGPGAACEPVTAITGADPCPLLSSRDDVVVTLRSTGLTRTVRPADTPADRRGLFRFDNVPPGAYTVTVERPGSTSQTLLVNTAVVGGLSPAMLDVRLDRPAVVGGRIRLHAGFGGTRRFNVEAYTVDAVGGTPLASTTTDGAGFFTLRGLPAPGSYVLEFEDRETSARRLFFADDQLELEPGVPIAFDDADSRTDLFFRDVPHGDATQLAFGTSPPVGSSVGQPLPAFTVEIRDADGVRVTDGPQSTSVVTISLGNNPSFAVLGGTISRAAVAGVVNFTGLELNQVGTGYTLRASSGLLAQIESPPFNVQPSVSAAPTAVTANAAFDGQVQVTWTAPPDPSGAPVLDYRIERRTGSGQWIVAQTDTTVSSGATTSRRVTGLAAGVSYQFRVLAVNSVGASAPSVASSAVTANVSPKTVSLASTGTVATGAFVERGYAFRLNTTVTVVELLGGGSEGTFVVRIRDGGTGANPFPASTALSIVASGDMIGSTPLQQRGISATVLEAGRWYWITQSRVSGSGSHLTTTQSAIATAIDRDLIRDWRFTDRNAWTGDTTLPALGFRVQ